MEGTWCYLEATWRVVEIRCNLLQLKKKADYLVVEPGEQGPGREGGVNNDGNRKSENRRKERQWMLT